VLVLGVAAYLQIASRPNSTPSEPTPETAATSPVPQKESGPPPAQPAESQPTPEKAEHGARTGPTAKTASKPPANSAERPSPETSSGASDTSAAAENGSQELSQAQRLLAARNPEVAARLLWKSVGKENGGAELALADLYTRGEGVGKNCEQARLLLVAAAKKGVGEAAQKLRNLESNGCR